MQSSEFVSLIEQHQGIVHKVCRLYCDNQQDREDLFQEIIFQLWKSMDSFHQRAKVTTWMYKVAIYTALTHVKKKKKFSENQLDIQENLRFREIPENYGQEDINRLYQSIGQLSETDRAIVLLYLEDQSYREISELMGISESNVGVRINRAKSKLKTIMQHG